MEVRGRKLTHLLDESEDDGRFKPVRVNASISLLTMQYCPMNVEWPARVSNEDSYFNPINKCY